jgi:hypothetical protein
MGCIDLTFRELQHIRIRLGGRDHVPGLNTTEATPPRPHPRPRCAAPRRRASSLETSPSRSRPTTSMAVMAIKPPPPLNSLRLVIHAPSLPCRDPSLTARQARCQVAKRTDEEHIRVRIRHQFVCNLSFSNNCLNCARPGLAARRWWTDPSGRLLDRPRTGHRRGVSYARQRTSDD